MVERLVGDEELKAIDDLARAWGEVCRRFQVPLDYNGEARADVFYGLQSLEGALRDRYVEVLEPSMLCLLHVVYASTSMLERHLWPQEMARLDEKIREAVHQASQPGAKTYTLEEVRERIRSRTKLAAKD